MTRTAAHREADIDRARKSASKDHGRWTVELDPSGVIRLIPTSGAAAKQKRAPAAVAHP